MITVSECSRVHNNGWSRTEISERHVRCYVPHDQQEAAVNHINAAAFVTTLRTALFLAASAMASEGLAFPVAPATLYAEIGDVQQQISGSTGLERFGRHGLDDDRSCIRSDRTRAGSDCCPSQRGGDGRGYL